MKTMRNALLAAGVLAALTVSANAQSVSPTNAEILMAGQIDVVQYLDLNNNGQFDATSDLPTVVDAYGFITGGALFGDPFSPDLFTGGPVSENARYTFSVVGLTLVQPASPPVGGNFNGRYINGAYNVWLDDDGGVGDPGGQSFSQQGDFTNGLLQLVGTVNVDSVFNLAGGFGTFDGTILFNPSGTSTPGGVAISPNPINTFLANNPGVLGGFFTNTGFSVASRTGFGEFGTTPQIELVPEPTTMALFGAGLLPLGAFLRRRRGA